MHSLSRWVNGGDSNKLQLVVLPEKNHIFVFFHCLLELDLILLGEAGEREVVGTYSGSLLDIHTQAKAKITKFKKEKLHS